MLRSRILIMLLAALAVGGAACAADVADAERTYLEVVRAAVPDAADIDDDTLLRLAFELCQAADADLAQQRAIEILHGEVGTFGIREFDVVSSALGAASEAICPLAAGPTGSAGALTSVSLETLPTREEAEAALEAFHEVLRESLKAGVPTIAVQGQPAGLELTESSLADGTLTVEVTLSLDGADADLVSYELARTLAPLDDQLMDHGPLFAALVRGGPSLSLRVVVDTGTTQALTVDSALLADMVDGIVSHDEWLDRISHADP